MKEFKDMAKDFSKNYVRGLEILQPMGEEVVDDLTLVLARENVIYTYMNQPISVLIIREFVATIGAVYYKERADHFEKLLKDVCNEESKKCQAS